MNGKIPQTALHLSYGSHLNKIPISECLFRFSFEFISTLRSIGTRIYAIITSTVSSFDFVSANNKTEWFVRVYAFERENYYYLFY